MAPPMPASYSCKSARRRRVRRASRARVTAQPRSFSSAWRCACHACLSVQLFGVALLVPLVAEGDHPRFDESATASAPRHVRCVVVRRRLAAALRAQAHDDHMLELRLIRCASKVRAVGAPRRARRTALRRQRARDAACHVSAAPPRRSDARCKLRCGRRAREVGRLYRHGQAGAPRHDETSLFPSQARAALSAPREAARGRAMRALAALCLALLAARAGAQLAPTPPLPLLAPGAGLYTPSSDASELCSYVHAPADGSAPLTWRLNRGGGAHGLGLVAPKGFYRVDVGAGEKATSFFYQVCLYARVFTPRRSALDVISLFSSHNNTHCAANAVLRLHGFHAGFAAARLHRGRCRRVPRGVRGGAGPRVRKQLHLDGLSAPWRVRRALPRARARLRQRHGCTSERVPPRRRPVLHLLSRRCYRLR
jgi:hypothetical protein